MTLKGKYNKSKLILYKQSGGALQNPLKINLTSEYWNKRSVDSTLQRKSGISNDVDLLIKNKFMSSPEVMRTKEMFGYKLEPGEYKNHFTNPAEMGKIDGLYAGTNAYLNSNQMGINNNQVVKLAELLKTYGGKDMKYAIEGGITDLKDFLNPIDRNRVMLEYNRQIQTKQKGGLIKYKNGK